MAIIEMKKELFSRESTNFIDFPSSLTGTRGKTGVGLWSKRDGRTKVATYSNFLKALMDMREKKYSFFINSSGEYCLFCAGPSPYILASSNLLTTSGEKSYYLISDGIEARENLFSSVCALQVFEDLEPDLTELMKGIIKKPEFSLSDEANLLACDIHYFSLGKKAEIEVDLSRFFGMPDDLIPIYSSIKEFDGFNFFSSTELSQMALFVGEKISIIPKADGKAPISSPDTFSDIGLFGEKTFPFYEKALNKEFIIDYDWGTAKELVTPHDFLYRYEPDETFEDICAEVLFTLSRVKERMDIGFTGLDAINSCDIVNISLFGKAGVGKTTLVKALSAAFGMPISTSSNSEYSDESEFEGKTKIVEGKPEFVPTSFLERFKNGGIIVNEEVVLTLPAVLQGALGQAVIEPFILKENGYKDVFRHPLCVIINTFNIADEGGKTLPANFSSRFTPYLMAEVSADDIATRLDKSQYGSELNNFEICRKISRCYTNVLSELSGDEMNRPDIAARITYRQCEQILRKCLMGIPLTRAIKVFSAKIAETEPMIASEIEKIITTIS